VDDLAADRILLKGLRLAAVVGVLPEERERAQPLECDISLLVDLSAAGVSDQLTDTVDYGAITDVVVKTIKTSQPELLERLATLVADAVLESDSRVGAVEVGIRKLRPPVPHDLASSGVEISRRTPSA